MLVSSAKKVGITYLTESSKLFIHIKNNIGPRMDPCGTPYLMYCSERERKRETERDHIKGKVPKYV